MVQIDTARLRKRLMRRAPSALRLDSATVLIGRPDLDAPPR
jgi:hypothetical protein